MGQNRTTNPIPFALTLTAVGFDFALMLYKATAFFILLFVAFTHQCTQCNQATSDCKVFPLCVSTCCPSSGFGTK